MHDRHHIAELAAGVLALAAWWRIPVRSVLDVGAGKGYWHDYLTASRPKIRYHGVDVSDYACRRYGHERADLAMWRPSRRYDLVVCQSVVQYLDDADATSAMATLGEACRGLMWLEIPTTDDRDNSIDPAATDLEVNWRTGAWYRERLEPAFTQIGGGLWLSRSSGAVLFELERGR